MGCQMGGGLPAVCAGRQTGTEGHSAAPETRRATQGRGAAAISTALPATIPAGLRTTIPAALQTTIPGALQTTIPTAPPTAIPVAIPTAILAAIPTAISPGILSVVQSGKTSCRPGRSGLSGGARSG